MKTDYRAPENRRVYFDKLYDLNLKHGIMPGCVYLLFPAFKHHYSWDQETALWFGFLNSLTQNPLTSLLFFEQLPEPPKDTAKFEEWFNSNWGKLPFDTDRLKNKRNTVKAIQSYVAALAGYSSQYDMLNKPFDDLWKFTTDNFYSWGRLSAWSGNEFLHIMGAPGVPNTLLFDDFSGSRSHRNGALFLRGDDHLVFDKRIDNGFDGKYTNFKELCSTLQQEAEDVIKAHPTGDMYTYESQCCQYKNTFFGRRYPGVYVSMLVERLKKHEGFWGQDRSYDLVTSILHTLPEWMWKEDGKTIPQRASIFPKTGFPYHGEHFL
jgi:hypothetical protein